MCLFINRHMMVLQQARCPIRFQAADDSSNVRGEPVFSVTAAGWFCEKSGGIGKVADVKPVLLKEKNGFHRQPF
jgi:hypothetical protein